jgi:hypothetical protein
MNISSNTKTISSCSQCFKFWGQHFCDT